MLNRIDIDSVVRIVSMNWIGWDQVSNGSFEVKKHNLNEPFD